MREEWKDILTFPSYEVSNKGNVRNKETKYILSIQTSNSGSKFVFMFYKGKIYGRTIGKLMQNAFGINPIKQKRINDNRQYKCPNCERRLLIVNKKEHSKVCKPRSKKIKYFEF